MKHTAKILLLLLAAALLTGCGRDMNWVIGNAPGFSGTVLAASEEEIRVAVDPADPVYGEYEAVTVSLETKVQDSMHSFSEGDRVKVYYDGALRGSGVGRPDGVWAVVLIEPADRNINNVS